MIVFTALRLDSFNTNGFPQNFTLREAPFICWTQAELSWSIIAATIPTARRLMLDFITYYNGGNFGSSRSQAGTGAYAGGTVRSGNNIQMKSLRSGNGKSDPYAGGSRGTTRGQDPDILSDNDSQEMIIRKDISIRVDNNGRVESRASHRDESRPNFI